MKKLVSLMLLASVFHYQDCVEIIKGFYYNPEYRYVGWVVDEDTNGQVARYQIGYFPSLWVEADNLKKVDSQICKDAEKQEIK